jgi:hypothetical protein
VNPAWTKEKYDETLRQLFQRSATDPAFRKRCLSDAAGAIKEISGLEPNNKVRFVEKIEEQLLVLPPLVQTGELDEKELDMVAAGKGVCSWTYAATTSKETKGTKGQPM